MIDRKWSDILTLFLKFLNLSVSRSSLSKSKILKLVKFGLFFFGLGEYVWFHRFSSLSLWERWTPDLLTLPTTFNDVSVSCNRFSKIESRHLRASGTDGLRNFKSILRVNALFWGVAWGNLPLLSMIPF